MAMGAGRIMGAMRMIPVAGALSGAGGGWAKRLHGDSIGRIRAGIDPGFAGKVTSGAPALRKSATGEET